ncbi:MAG: CsbD family protein [Candidatus Binataceae bacterium]
MSQDQIKGKLTQLKGEIKSRWGKLTDDDIMEAHGDVSKLIGRIRERSGDQREAVEKSFKDVGLA